MKSPKKKDTSASPAKKDASPLKLKDPRKSLDKEGNLLEPIENPSEDGEEMDPRK